MRRVLCLMAIAVGFIAVESKAFAFQRYYYYQSAATPAMNPLLLNFLLGIGDTLVQDVLRPQQPQQPPATGLPPAQTLPTENPKITDLKQQVAAINAKVGNPPAPNANDNGNGGGPGPAAGDPKPPTNGFPDFYPR